MKYFECFCLGIFFLAWSMTKSEIEVCFLTCQRATMLIYESTSRERLYLFMEVRPVVPACMMGISILVL